MASRSNSVCVVGSSNIDLSFYVDEFPHEGQTLHCKSFARGYGGKGANQAVQAAKLCGNNTNSHNRVMFVSCVGDDSDGTALILYYRDEIGLDTTYVKKISKENTGLASITVDAKGRNQIIINGGANEKLSKEVVDEAWDDIRKCKVVVCQLECPLDTCVHLLKKAHEESTTATTDDDNDDDDDDNNNNNTITTIFNTAPAPSEITQELLDGIKYAQILCPNESEAQLLTSVTINTPEDAKQAARKLREMGANTIIITLGEKGCILMEKHSNECEHIPTEKVHNVKDTTGAGDSFVGSLAYFLSCGDKLASAIKKANHVAGVSIQNLGTQSSYPTRDELPASLFQ